MKSSVVITTKNRLQGLREAITSALAQTAEPEILVIDDGSTDGTAQAVSREFPSVTVHRSEQSLGYIAQRNRAATMCKSPIMFSIDDDAVFSTSRVVEQTLSEFDHFRVGGVAIPFKDVNRSPAVYQKAPTANGIYANYGYIGTAHAVRRDLFLNLSGYREVLFHQGEEEDYCIRLLGAGYVIRAGNSDLIYHYESPRRSWTRMDFYGARNKILYTWFNVPFPYLPGHLAVTTAKTLSYSLTPKRFLTRLKGVLAGFYFCAVHPLSRQPVSAAVYRLSRLLRKHGDLPFETVEK
jgi:glycosyltransferase involved in cell wall biosynthesis